MESDTLTGKAPRIARPSIQRVLMLLELILGAAFLIGGAVVVILGIVTGHHDPRHGGGFIILIGGFLVLVGLSITIPGIALRTRHPAKWLLQLIPLAGLIYWLST
jgi:hypothetical protein